MSACPRQLPAVAILLATTIALTPVTTARALSAPLGSVKGSVKSAVTGAALSQVKVLVSSMNRRSFIAEAVTNEEGKLSLAGLPLGFYQVTVVPREGHAPAPSTLVYLTALNPEAVVEFSLEALPQPPVATKSGGFPTSAVFVFIAAAIAITSVAIAIGGGTPDQAVGTR